MDAVSGRSESASSVPRIAVVADPAFGRRLAAAHDRLAAGGLQALPAIDLVRPEGRFDDQASRLLHAPAPPDAVLDGRAGGLLLGPAAAVSGLRAPISLLLAEAREPSAPSARIADVAVRPTPPPPPSPADRRGVARIGQTALFALTIMLASMLLSNMIEEKSNKVIEVLAAAVPVRAIFLGKLFGMLAISLTGLVVWASAAAILAVLILPASALPAAPACGWIVFALLGLVYFATNYLLLGAVFLGLGSQASSVREVQTLSMPVTMAQLVLFALASGVVGDPAGPLAIGTMLFPWSSPLASIARAAELPALWPNAMLVAWQTCWVAVTVIAGAAMFRRNVLQSGAPKKTRASDRRRSRTR